MVHDILKMADRMWMGVGKFIKDELLLKGNVTVELYGPDGKLKTTRRVHNTVTTAGKANSADQLLDAPSKVVPGWMELGEGTPGATKLGDYIAGSRTALDTKTRAANNVVTMVCTFPPATGTGVVTEAGVFNVVTEDTVDMYLSASFAAVNKLAADSMIVTWTFTFN